MKTKIKQIYCGIKQLPYHLKIMVLAALLISIISSSATYYFLQKQIPKFAVIDLAYLNNDFVVTLSRYLLDHKASDDEVAKMVKNYLVSLEAMLGDIHKSGNYVLLQKQMVVSNNIVDLTPELEKALFESIINSKK